ncbi:MAG: EamA family transporter [Rhodospirillaceae bacterium]
MAQGDDVPQEPKPRLATELALLGLLALFWGSSYLFIKVAVAELPPITLIAARVSIAALFLLAVLHVRRIRLPRGAALWGQLLVQSILISIAAWTILAWGQQYMDAGLASVLNSTSPIFVYFITRYVTRHETTGGMKLFGACLGLLGVVLIVGVDALDGLGRHIWGQVAVVFGAVLYAASAIYGKRFTGPPAATAAGAMIWAVVVLVPASLIVDRPWTLAPSSAALGATACLGLGSTGIALLLYFRLVRTLGSMGVASQAYLRAGFGVMLGIVVLGETITPIVALGIAAAILGVAAINLSGRRRQPT